eukprot:2183118-Rhodomonas_salina.5
MKIIQRCCAGERRDRSAHARDVRRERDRRAQRCMRDVSFLWCSGECRVVPCSVVLPVLCSCVLRSACESGFALTFHI